MANVLNPDILNKLIEYSDGKTSFVDLAKRLGISTSSVAAYVVKLNLPRPKKPSVTSEATKKKIRELSDGLRPYCEIARLCGVTNSVVEAYCRKNDLPRTNVGAPLGDRNPKAKLGMSVEQKQKVLELYDQGLSLFQIAEDVGRTHNSVEKFLHKSGLNNRKAGPPTGKRNPAYYDGRTNRRRPDRKRVLVSEDHPSFPGTIAESRLIMEKVLGRYLTEEEVVHHRNEDPLNDHPDNLRLFPSQAEHMRYHFSPVFAEERQKELELMAIRFPPSDNDDQRT